MDEIIKEVFMYKNKEYYINWILEIYHKDKINYSRKIQKIEQLKAYVIQNTPLLNDPIYTFTTKLAWIVNNITDFPTCPTCKKKFGYNKNIRLFRCYSQHCSQKCVDKDIIRNQKIQQTCLRKGKQTAAKIRQTCRRKYGVDNVSQVPQIMDKIKVTLKNIYDDPVRYQQILDKRKITSLSKYGVQHYSQTQQFRQYISDYLKGNQEFIQKLNEIRLEKYGTTNVFEIPSVREKQIKQKNDEAYNLILTWNQYVIPLFDRNEYVSRSHNKIYKWKCVKCNNIFQFQLGKSTTVSSISKYIPACPKCYPKKFNRSRKQKELSAFCKQFFPKLQQNNKQLIKPLQLDIVIPQINLAIQFNGIFWHSIDRKPPLYHLDKTLACEAIGYRLIHIWQDQWENNKNDIKEKLIDIFLNKEILNLSDQFILNREWYQYNIIDNYDCQIIMPSITLRNNVQTENCGFLKYTKRK